MTKKVVLKLGVHDEKAKQKALKAVSSLCGVESLAMDMNEKKLTIVGAVDPVEVVCKLKKWHTEILTVGPAKEPEKKEGPKKDDAKKDDGKKKESEQIEELLKLCKNYYSSYCTPYPVYSVEIPNACVPWCVHEHPCFF